MTNPELAEPETIDPVMALTRVATTDELSIQQIRDAINWVNPNEQSAIFDTEIILDVATLGLSKHPDDEDWIAVADSAQAIHRHRLNIGRQK